MFYYGQEEHPHLHLRLVTAPVGPTMHTLLREQLQLSARGFVYTSRPSSLRTMSFCGRKHSLESE